VGGGGGGGGNRSLVSSPGLATSSCSLNSWAQGTYGPRIRIFYRRKQGDDIECNSCSLSSRESQRERMTNSSRE